MAVFFPVNAWIVFPLTLISIMLAAFFSNKKIKLLIIVLLSVFTVMELISIYFSGGFVDYQFFVNLNISDIVEGLFIFKLQAVLAIVVFFALLFVLFKLSILAQKKLPFVVRLFIFIMAFMSLNYSAGPIEKLLQIYQVTTAPKIEFTTAIDAIGMQDYPTKTQINAQKGKNIIVISLESFEQGFFDFKSLTPNLNKLRQQYHFYPNMPMATGSSWTTASMYTYMTGMPFLIGGYDMPPLSGANQTQLVSLGDVLHNADYQTRYVIGGPDFAGIGHVISLFDIDIISEKLYPGEYPAAPFGLYDKDIFNVAQRQVEELSQSDKPFALFISSISTHAPDGFKDPRMESIIDNDLDNMSFVAASLDYNVGQFFEYLKQKGLLDNTVFYIFPDHLMMGSATQTIANLSQNPRKLYLLTNANLDDLPYQPSDTIYQMDMPRIILDGAKVSTNARFLTDYLTKGSDKKQFVAQNKTKIATINHSAEQ